MVVGRELHEEHAEQRPSRRSKVWPASSPEPAAQFVLAERRGSATRSTGTVERGSRPPARLRRPRICKVVRSDSWRATTAATACSSARTSSGPLQPDRQPDVPDRAGPIELVEKPQPLLGEGRGETRSARRRLLRRHSGRGVHSRAPRIGRTGQPWNSGQRRAADCASRSLTRRARPRTVGASNTLISGSSTPKRSATAATSRVASSEWPPSSKKSSFAPDPATPSSSPKMRDRVHLGWPAVRRHRRRACGARTPQLEGAVCDVAAAVASGHIGSCADDFLQQRDVLVEEAADRFRAVQIGAPGEREPHRSRPPRPRAGSGRTSRCRWPPSRVATCSPSRLAARWGWLCRANSTCTSGLWASERRGLQHLHEFFEGHVRMLESLRASTWRTRPSSSRKVGSPRRSVRITSVLTKNPIRSSSRRVRAPGDRRADQHIIRHPPAGQAPP